MKKQLTAKEARERLAALCNASEQCSTDLRMKLARWGIGAGDAAAIMKWLAETRLVDDARFCRAFARSKMNYNCWGRYKISMALAAKRLDRSLIAEAIDALDADEYREAAIRALRAALRRYDADDYTGRMKLLRSVAARGFEPAMLMKLLQTRAEWDS